MHHCGRPGADTDGGMPAARRKSSRSTAGGSAAPRASSPSHSPSRRRADRVKVAPAGQSIVWQMVEHDPTPTALQALYAMLTASGLLVMSRLPALLRDAIPSLSGCGQSAELYPSSKLGYNCSDGWEGKTYDDVIGISDAAITEPRTTILLLCNTTGLTDNDLQLAAAGTAAAFALLGAADLLSIIFPQAIAWPKSWNTDNRQCYTDMFAEPTRDSLLRRPGNVYSNCLYLFNGLIVLMSCFKEQNVVPNVFWLADSSESCRTSVHTSAMHCR